MSKSEKNTRPRRPWWRRLLKWLMATVGVLLLVTVLLVAWVAGTRSGLDFAWSLVQPRLPDSMAVAQIEGRLTGPLTITGVMLDTDTMHVAVDRIHLEWRMSDLLSGTLHVEQLAVEGVRYTGKPSESKPSPAEDDEPFALPVNVRLDELTVEDVRVMSTPEAEPFVLAQAHVQDLRLTADQWKLAKLTAHGPLFDINAQATVTPHGGYATELALDAQLRLPDLAPIDAKVHLAGDLDRLKLSANVAAPYNVTLDAQISDIALDAIEQIGIDATLALDRTKLTAIRADLPPVAPVTTQLHVSGTVGQLAIEQSVAAPYNASLDATLTDVLTTPVIGATLQLSDTQLAAIQKTLPKINLDTTATVSGTPKDLALQLDARIDSDRFGAVNLIARIHYDPEAVTIKKLTMKRPDSPMRLNAEGTVALARGNAMDLTLSWQHLHWPLSGQPSYVSKQGEFKLAGSLDNYELQGHMQWQVADQAAGQLQLAGTGDLQSFQLEKLSITGGPGDISAHAKVAWAPELAIEAHVEGTHINPAAIVPEVPGDFALTADVEVKQNEQGAILAHVNTLTAQGQLRGLPLQLDGQLAYLGDHIKISQLALDYGQTHVKVSGRAGWTPDAKLALQWSIASKDLSQLWPKLAGTLKTTGRGEGTVSAPSIDATLTARDIKYNDYRVAAVDLDADVDWSGATQSHVALDVSGVQAAGQKVESITFNLAGTPAQHAANLDLDSNTAQLALTLDGGLNKQQEVWDFTLTDLQVAYGKLAPWTLVGPASGQLSADTQRIADACLSSGDARLCVTGQHNSDGTQASLQLSDLAFAYAEPFMPDNLDISGALSGTVDVKLPKDGTPVAKVQMKTTAGEVVTRRGDGEQVRVLAFEPAHIEASLADTALHATLDLPLDDTGHIKAQFAVAPGKIPLTKRPLSGALHIDVTKLDFVTRLVSEIADISGQISGDMRISGTLAAPQVMGDIALNASRLVLLSPGLVLTDVQMTASGQGDAIDLALSAHSGGGTLSVDGGVSFDGAGPTIELTIDGKAFQIANTPMVRAWISPDMAVAVTPKAVQVTGVLKVPKARITPRNLPAAGVQTVAGDAVIVDQKKGVAEKAARAITADIKVVLGDVRIKGFGLKTGINGALRVQQVPGEPVTGTGKLTLVDGSYRAYGQNLDIQSGHIYFAGGPIANPGVELRAARYPAEDVTVGVLVTGSVEKPDIKLWSEPAMSQAEILSWLLLGRPLEGTTDGQGNLIAKAALALGGGRSNKVLDNIGDALGLDDIGLGSAAGHGAGETAFMVGKYLTPKLYISYGVGIFSSVSTLSLRYTLNSHWKLQSQSSDVATGADIIYTFER